MRRLANIFGAAVVCVYLWPLVLAVWTSFSAGTMLDIPDEYSLRWYREFFETSRWWKAFLETLKVASISSAMSVIAALGLAIGVVRRRLAAARWLSAAVMLPMFVPPIVLGMSLLPVVRFSGVWGSSWAVAAAHAVWTLPISFLILRDAVAGIDESLISASRGLGATDAQVLRHVVLPLSAPAIVVATVVAFVLSVNEFVIALFLTTPQTETLPKVIWPNLRYTLTPIVSAASGVSLAFAMLAGGALWWLRRSPRTS